MLLLNQFKNKKSEIKVKQFNLEFASFSHLSKRGLFFNYL